jgi:hypothetical protein
VVPEGAGECKKKKMIAIDIAPIGKLVVVRL